jgi:hypothetical protein
MNDDRFADDISGTAGGRHRPSMNQTIITVAGILIAIGVLLKLYRMRTQGGDERAFQHIQKEVEALNVSESGKEALRDVVDFARELTQEARAADA